MADNLVDYGRDGHIPVQRERLCGVGRYAPAPLNRLSWF